MGVRLEVRPHSRGSLGGEVTKAFKDVIGMETQLDNRQLGCLYSKHF